MRDALSHFQAHLAQSWRRGLRNIEIEEVGPTLTGNFQNVAKSRGGDQAGLGPLRLEDRIRCKRGSMAEEGELIGRNSRHVKQFADALENANRRVVWRRWYLMEMIAA